MAKDNIVNYDGTKLAATKEIVTQIAGLSLISLSALLLGLFDFSELRFDFGKILTSEFWINYFIKLALYYTAFIGMYIITRNKQMQSKRTLTHKGEIQKLRKYIVENRLIEDLDNWLDNVYGLKIAIIAWKFELERKYKKERKNKIRGNYKAEHALISKYDKLLLAREKKNVEEEQELLKTLPEYDHNIERRKRGVNYNNLFNVDYYSHLAEESIFVREMWVVMQKILPSLGVGMVAMAFISTMLPPMFKPLTAESIINCVISLFFLALYCFNGARIASDVVNINIYNADNVRISIVERFKIYQKV